MSHESERLHRPDPARERPIRDAYTYARDHAWGQRADPVSEGVRLGYSVLDEQLREGQRLAERLRGVSRGQPSLDLGALLERALNIYRDIGGLAFAAAEALARSPGVGVSAGASSSFGAGPRPPGPEPYAAPRGSAYALEVRSSRRVSVKLDLRGTGAPSVGPLQPAQRGAPPIETVGFAAGPVLQLEIADDQPAGVYNAVLTDADSGEPVGTLTVRIPA
jgi:hypothetical protein